MKLNTPRWWYVRDSNHARLTRTVLKPLGWLWAGVTARRIARAAPVDPGNARDTLEGHEERRCAIGARCPGQALGVAPFAFQRPAVGAGEGVTIQQFDIRQPAISEHRLHAQQPADIRYGVEYALGG